MSKDPKISENPKAEGIVSMGGLCQHLKCRIQCSKCGLEMSQGSCVAEGAKYPENYLVCHSPICEREGVKFRPPTVFMEYLEPKK